MTYINVSINIWYVIIPAMIVSIMFIFLFFFADYWYVNNTKRDNDSIKHRKENYEKLNYRFGKLINYIKINRDHIIIKLLHCGNVYCKFLIFISFIAILATISMSMSVDKTSIYFDMEYEDIYMGYILIPLLIFVLCNILYSMNMLIENIYMNAKSKGFDFVIFVFMVSCVVFMYSIIPITGATFESTMDTENKLYLLFSFIYTYMANYWGIMSNLIELYLVFILPTFFISLLMIEPKGD